MIKVLKTEMVNVQNSNANRLIWSACLPFPRYEVLRETPCGYRPYNNNQIVLFSSRLYPAV